ncbi:MAG: hypothetical protein V2B18_03780 [Pseudomonadota bacterium]
MNAKPKIDAMEALKDIRAGVDDLTLMKKYNLSVKGLQSLLKKLAGTGILKQLNATQLVADIHAGLNDFQLMEKHGLSAKGLQNVLDQLVVEGLIKESDIETRPDMSDETVDVRKDMLELDLDMDVDVRSGPIEVGPVDTLWECPSCGQSQTTEFDECPACGIVVSKYLKKKARETAGSTDLLEIETYFRDAKPAAPPSCAGAEGSDPEKPSFVQGYYEESAARMGEREEALKQEETGNEAFKKYVEPLRQVVKTLTGVKTKVEIDATLQEAQINELEEKLEQRIEQTKETRDYVESLAGIADKLGKQIEALRSDEEFWGDEILVKDKRRQALEEMAAKLGQDVAAAERIVEQQEKELAELVEDVKRWKVEIEQLEGQTAGLLELIDLIVEQCGVLEVEDAR